MTSKVINSKVMNKTAESTSLNPPSARSTGENAVGRRRFLKSIGIAGATLAAGGGVSAMMATKSAAGEIGGGRIASGDVAILKFLAAAKILESDLWQQYTELALGNSSFLKALQVLDGDMPTYVNQNTRDEFSHAAFINA